MSKYYSGRFRPTNIAKYDGDYNNIQYRSHWELMFMRWLDKNPDVVKYSSEETIIPYICATDNRPHRYFMDFKVKFSNGRVYLFEIKPKCQTVEPVKKKSSPAYIKEVMTWAKNSSKWKAAEKYCEERGYKFQILTEDGLASLGIKLLKTNVPKKKTIPKKKKLPSK